MASTLEIPSLNHPQFFSQAMSQLPLPYQLGAQEGTLPPGLIQAIIKQESGGKSKAHGAKGEVGLMQIMPATAAQFGVTPDQLADPAVNQRVGTQYLQSLVKRYKGNIPMALAAYNAGPGNIDRGVIPKSTQGYVSKILGSLKNAAEGTAEAAELPPQLKGAIEVDQPWKDSLRAVPNPWQDKSAAAPSPTKAEAFYEKKIAQPLTGGLAGLLGKLNPQGLAASGVMAGTTSPQAMLGAKPLDSGVTQSIANTVVPQNLTELGVDAGLMASGLGEMGLLTRLGVAGLGGALGSKAQGKDLGWSSSSAGPVGARGRLPEMSVNAASEHSVGGFLKSTPR